MNILVIGLGSIAQKHIVAIRELVVDPVIYALRSSRKVNSEPGIKNVYSLDDLEVKPDFIIISNPTNLHAVAIEQTLSLDCPLFIEKPVLNNLDKVDFLSRSIQQKNILTYIACNLRFHPVIQFLHGYLNENPEPINEVSIYCGSYLPDWRPGRNFRTIYSTNREMGGGVHLDLIHELDYCCWLFGKPEEIISLKRNVSTLQINAEDFAHYNLLYSTFSAAITLNYFRRDSRRDLEIVMEQHTVKADLLRGSVINLNTQETMFQKPCMIQETYTNQMKYFIEHVKINQKPMNDFFESIEILKIALS